MEGAEVAEVMVEVVVVVVAAAFSLEERACAPLLLPDLDLRISSGLSRPVRTPLGEGLPLVVRPIVTYETAQAGGGDWWFYERR